MLAIIASFKGVVSIASLFGCDFSYALVYCYADFSLSGRDALTLTLPNAVVAEREITAERDDDGQHKQHDLRPSVRGYEVEELEQRSSDHQKSPWEARCSPLFFFHAP